MIPQDFFFLTFIFKSQMARLKMGKEKKKKKHFACLFSQAWTHITPLPHPCGRKDYTFHYSLG